jgi:hypothetical protein
MHLRTENRKNGSVEEGDQRARALCERLGYVAYGRQPDASDVEVPHGSIRDYGIMCTPMCKEIP